jgi:agmatinase
MTSKNFMNLPKEYRDKNKSKVVIFPVSFKTKTTRKNDSNLGPKAIIEASHELEYYEEDLFCEPHEKGIFTEEQLTIKETDFAKIKHKILDKFSKIYDSKKFPITLGSDHSTTIPIIEALEKKEKDFGIIVFDAHSDLREPWGKDTWWHACVSREISKKHKTLLVGIRSMDNNDLEYLQSREGNNTAVIFGKDLLSSQKQHNWDLSSCFQLEEKLRQLPKKIYISIDVDVFDPSIIRYTDTPEPGGLNWTQTNNLLKIVFREKEVIGVDLVEFSPEPKNKAVFCESYLLAKLIYKIIAYKYYIK